MKPAIEYVYLARQSDNDALGFAAAVAAAISEIVVTATC